MIRTNSVVVVTLLALAAAPACGSSEARSQRGGSATKTVSHVASAATTTGSDPCALEPARRLLWGDLHVHTSYSLDSYVFNNTNTPADAYAFAQGSPRPISGNAANQASIGRKLDFAAVTDHSEFLDVMEQCVLDPAAPSYDSAYCTDYRVHKDLSVAFSTRMAQLLRPDPTEAEICDGPVGSAQCTAARMSAWQRTQEAANLATQSDCSFTALIAFEWTATTGGDNLHRNVFFGSSSVPVTPLDYIHYPTVESLWSGLDQRCTGDCRALAVPHNSNLSGGNMWNNASDSANLAQLQKYQRLVEVYQHKGNSECYPSSSPLYDPECTFEMLGNADLASRPGFIREALAQGLEAVHGKSAANNPLMLGFVGATDTHNGLPGYVAEEGWQGHAADNDDEAVDRIEDFPAFSPGAITGVWARANTRAEIFAALHRRETYATSGTRIAVRFFAKTGIASQAEADAFCADPSFPASLEAAGGVPMGAEYATNGQDVWLFVHAAKDVVDLDKIDLVEMRTDATGKVRSVTIDAGDGAVPNPTTPCVARKMPKLTGASRGLAYARVYEKKSWRWSHYDCQDPAASTTEACTKSPEQGGVDKEIQERAWTSPIFLR